MAENKENLKPDTLPSGLTPEAESDVDKTRRIDVTMETEAQTSEASTAGEAEANDAAAVPEAAEAETETTENDTTEAPSDDKSAAESYSAAEGTDARLLSEFAPKPIKIPNVDLEKEKKKQEKRRKNRSKEVKKVEARKNKNNKKKSTGQKVLVGIAGFLLFVLLTVSMAGFISVLSVQTATSEYAFRLSVKNMNIPEITIGNVKNYDMLGLGRSSSGAALVDIIRDNSDVVITYKEISSSIRSSSVETFIAERLKSAADYLLKGEAYDELTGKDIAAVIKENATLVRNLTGRVLSDDDYTTIANYFEEYGNLEDISREMLDKTRISKYTDITRHIMSLQVLGALLLICIVLIILMCIVCRGSTYLPLGWSFILSGVAVILGAIFFRPSYTVGSDFLKSVLSSYFTFFTTAVIIIAGIITVIGAFIFLIGNASADHDE